jgi:hypothetical protein
MRHGPRGAVLDVRQPGHTSREPSKRPIVRRKKPFRKKFVIVAGKEPFVDERDLFWPAPPVMREKNQ